MRLFRKQREFHESPGKEVLYPGAGCGPSTNGDAWRRLMEEACVNEYQRWIEKKRKEGDA